MTNDNCASVDLELTYEERACLVLDLNNHYLKKMKSLGISRVSSLAFPSKTTKQLYVAVVSKAERFYSFGYSFNGFGFEFWPEAFPIFEVKKVNGQWVKIDGSQINVDSVLVS